MRQREHMRELGEIDVLGDEALRARMLRWSLAVFASTLLATVVLLACAQPTPLEALGALGGAILASVVVLPVHELLHAAAFKLLGGGDVKISFGHAAGCLYTRTNDAILPQARFVAVLLAPSVVLTAALVGGGIALGSLAGGVLAAGLHLTGCTGDLLMAWIILRTPGCVHVQDTDAGCRLLA